MRSSSAPLKGEHQVQVAAFMSHSLYISEPTVSCLVDDRELHVQTTEEERNNNQQITSSG